MGSDFLKNGIVLLDGATGTVFQQKGLPPGGRPELLNLSDPELVRSVHREYLEAGSQVVYANTFGANRLKLADTGRSVEEVVGAGVRLAREACAGTGGRTALDMGPLGELLEPLGSLRFEQAYEIFRDVAVAGAAAGGGSGGH